MSSPVRLSVIDRLGEAVHNKPRSAPARPAANQSVRRVVNAAAPAHDEDADSNDGERLMKEEEEEPKQKRIAGKEIQVM